MPFASLILDVDSTLSGIEGVDWLAARRGSDLAARVEALTARAMDGSIALDDIYGARLDLIRPRREEVEALSREYVRTVAVDAITVLTKLRDDGCRVALVSGGLREAILPLAAEAGIEPGDVHAVGITFDDRGEYSGFDSASPMTTQSGKRAVAASLQLPRPVLAVGDGATDLAMRDVVDVFAAYTGFVRREPVVQGADLEISSFSQLLEVVRR